MAAHPDTPTREETTASPLDRHAPPVSDHTTATGQRQSGLAIASLVVSIIAIPLAILFWPLGVLLGIIGIVLGAVARGQIGREGMTGAGQAKAGMICGAAAIVLAIVWIAFVVAVIMD